MAIDPMARALIASFENEYTPADEGKVVDNGALVSQTSTNITANGTYNTTLNNEVVVNVSGNQKLKNIISGAGEYSITAEDLEGATIIRQYAFYNTKLTSIQIPATITTLQYAAFQNTDLEDIIIPSNVSSVSGYLCASCTKLKTATWNAVVGIGTYIFSGCTLLEKIDMGSRCSSIGGLAFENCTSLRTIIARRDTPPTLSATSFNNVPADALIYVPDASVDAYKAASNWSARASYIKPLSEYTPS